MTNAEMLKRRVLCAKGKIMFDKVFYNARLINVYTEQIIQNAVVCVLDGVIVSVCPTFEPMAKEKIDCRGMYLAPSFIDAHMHIESSHLTPAAYCEGAVPHGTGAIFYDPMQIANAAGEVGLKSFVKMFEGLPLKSFLQFPSRVPAAEGMETACANFTPNDTYRIMKTLDAKTLGEVNADDLENERTLEKIIAAQKIGVAVNGHCPALDYNSLCCAAAVGIRDDHESETYEELYERLSLGLAVFIREGTIEPNCETLIKGVVENNLPIDSLMFCTDDKSPADIVKNGCIDNCIRIALKCKMPLCKAIKMATLNPARHYGIDNKIGSVTSGREANFILFEDESTLNIKAVYFGGDLVARDGKLIKKYSSDYEKEYKNLLFTVKISDKLNENDLSPKLPKEKCKFDATVMKMRENSLMTEKIIATLTSENGLVKADIQKDILPITVIERFGKNGNIGHGFINGLGIKCGAIAASTAQEGNNLVVSGVNYSDMLCAVKEVEKIGGGVVICIDGKIISEHIYSLGGILGVGTIEEEIAFSEKLSLALKLTGSKNDKLLSSLIVSTCPSIPDIALTDMGVIDVKSQKFIPCIQNIQSIAEDKI